MENNSKGGYFRRTNEGRRDYGSNGFGNEEKRVPRQKRPRIGRPSVEKMFSSNDERRFSPDRSRSYGGGQREFGERRYYGDRREDREHGNFGERRRVPAQYGDRRPSSDYGRGHSFEDNRYFYSSDEECRPYRNTKRAAGNQGQHGRPQPGRKPGARPFAKKPVMTPAQTGINRMIDRKRKQAEEAMSDFDYTPVPVKEEVRLNKFISNSGICSRREADNFILAGVVTVNGYVVTELGTKININTDDVRFNGERIRGEKKVYIVMNKPKGFVTTTSDPHAEKTVMDLLKGCKSRVFSVGRLDKNTTGVLMFTNDGEMAEKLTHPSYNKKKIYQVTLNNELSQEDFDKILGGVMLTDGEIAADELEYIDDSDHKKIGIEIHSGKNRIVRRIFESLGYEVKALDRVYFAGLTKKGLKKGQWRYLSEGEVNILKMGSYQ